MVDALPRPAGLGWADLVDIGVNLTASQFDQDLPSVLERARAAGVVRQLVTGTDLPHSHSALALAAAHPGELFATAGVHPHAAAAVPAHWRQELGDLLADPEVRAAGETGLDFNRDYSPRPDQEAVFIAQLELAAEHRKPVFLHERDTEGRFFDLLAPLADDLTGGVLHCFTGSERDLDRALTAGLHIGITGWICDERRGGTLAALAPRIPAERLMIETDAPWLLPRTIRPRQKSRRNEPGLLPWVLAALAACRDEDPMELARTTTANACRLFGLPLP
ncbi:MAG: TatD family hydrolase [Gammaproteobacteria bacterium]|nr:TatD family hydrolase [Gammaproteobacteria bacterium]